MDKQENTNRMVEGAKKAVESVNQLIVARTAGKCKYAEELKASCCKNKYRCHHPTKEGFVYPKNFCCFFCPDFSPADDKNQ